MSDTQNEFISPEEPVDLTNCDREPIHILGRVQSYGFLIAVTPDWIINHVSVNIEEVLNEPAQDLIGQPLVQFMSKHAVHDIRAGLQMLGSMDSIERMFAKDVFGDGRLYDVGVHFSGRSIILEFERNEGDERKDQISVIRPMIDRIGRARDTVQACDLAARQLKSFTGFDRVMVYRFDKDDCGEVIAEAVKPGMDSFKGLRYPATDIPKQARELYKRNLLRIISDVNEEGVEIIPARGPEGIPLDLSLSVTRAVSPIHLEYLRNMGVEASMSVSIIKRGKLWGLFACHHEAPLTLPFEVRTAAELFAQLFSFVLDQKESDLERDHYLKAQILHDQIMTQLADGADLSKNFEMIVGAIRNVIPFDSAMGWIDGQLMHTGRVPAPDQCMRLTRFLNTTAAGRIYATDCLKDAFPPAEDYSDVACGVLALPVSRVPRDYLVLFRQEIVRSVTWAGNPDKPVSVTGKHGVRLTPRKSFEAWQEIVRHHSQPWQDEEIRAAEALRVTLMEVVLRLTDTVIQERSRAQERQELLIAELNHRVRNILTLIRGLISQSAGEDRSVEDYIKVLGGRVYALSRAHDQITQKNWSPASLLKLIGNEIEAYLGDKADKVKISGGEVMLEPAAFTTLSLVVHELVTNSAKYGALSSENGQVTIDLSYDQAGDLYLAWRESGGPIISQQPTRRGFGSTIIERAVPFELKGSSDVRFATTGLEVDLRIPERFIAELPEDEDDAPVVQDRALKKSTGGKSPTGIPDEVFILEDNTIIALDAEDYMLEIGAKTVHTASGVSDAMKLLERIEPGFALLDVNLSDETCEPVAKHLKTRGVPFAFATGYGDAVSLVKRFPEVTVIQKPYTINDLKALFE